MDTLTAALIAFLSIAAGTAARIADRRVRHLDARASGPLGRAQNLQDRDGVSTRPLASA